MKHFRNYSLGDFLHREDQILEDAPRAEVDLGADLHARDEPVAVALTLSRKSLLRLIKAR